MFFLLLEYYNTCVNVIDKYNKQMTYVHETGMSNPISPMVRKVFKEHRNFFFVCVCVCESSKSTFEKYIGRLKLRGGNGLVKSCAFFPVATSMSSL